MIAKKLKPLALAAAATLVCTVGAVASTTPEPTEADIAVTAETSEITMLESLGTVAVAEADEALRSVTIVPAPSALSVLLLGCLGGGRRRRSCVRCPAGSEHIRTRGRRACRR